MSTPIAILLDASGRRRSTLVMIKGVSKGLDGLPEIQCGPNGDIPGLLPPQNPIRIARLAAGVSQQDLAAAMGISQPMLCKMERPGRALRRASVQRAKEALDSILEFRRRWAASPQTSQEALMEAQGPLVTLSLARKARDPIERELLLRRGDPLVSQETLGREKVAGARSLRPRRAIGKRS